MADWMGGGNGILFGCGGFYQDDFGVLAEGFRGGLNP